MDHRNASFIFFFKDCSIFSIYFIYSSFFNRIYWQVQPIIYLNQINFILKLNKKTNNNKQNKYVKYRKWNTISILFCFRFAFVLLNLFSISVNAIVNFLFPIYFLIVNLAVIPINIRSQGLNTVAYFCHEGRKWRAIRKKNETCNYLRLNEFEASKSTVFLKNIFGNLILQHRL